MQIVATRSLTTRLAAPVLAATPAGTTQINLTWTAPTPTGQSVIAGRRLYRATSATGPWTEIPASGTASSATGLTNGVRYYFYVEYYDQYGPGLPSAVVSELPSPLTSGQKKWFPGWIIHLDGFIGVPAHASRHLATTWSQSGDSGHIIETAGMPNVTAIKVLCYWGTLERGTTVSNAVYDFTLIRQYLARCQAAGKKLFLSVFPVAFGGGNWFDGSIYPQYISGDSVTYGISAPMYYGSGSSARLWKAAVNERLILLHEALAAEFDGHPNFGGCQTEETTVNIPEGQDGCDFALYDQELKRQITRLSAAFTQSQIRTSTNYFNEGNAAGIDIIAHCASHGCGCGGPDVIPREFIAANKIFCGFVGGIDYRGPGPYGPGTGGANKTPWYSEIQWDSLGSGKEGNYTMQQLYDCAMLGRTYASATPPPGPAITIPGYVPMNPNFMVIYRNMTDLSPWRLLWYRDIKPFINSHIGYGSNVYPVNQPS